MEAFCDAATVDELVESMFCDAAAPSDGGGAQPALREGAGTRTPPPRSASSVFNGGDSGDGALADLEAFLEAMTP